MSKIHSISLLLALMTSLSVSAQEKFPNYLPELHKCHYPNGGIPKVSKQDKPVIEIMTRF